MVCSCKLLYIVHLFCLLQMDHDKHISCGLPHVINSNAVCDNSFGSTYLNRSAVLAIVLLAWLPKSYRYCHIRAKPVTLFHPWEKSMSMSCQPLELTSRSRHCSMTSEFNLVLLSSSLSASTIVFAYTHGLGQKYIACRERRCTIICSQHHESRFRWSNAMTSDKLH